MARLPALIDALAAVDGRPRGAVDHVGRVIREAGLIQTTKRGRGAAEMTARDAAWLVIGLYGADQPANAVHAAKVFGGAAPLGYAKAEFSARPDLRPLAAAQTLVDALAAVIELGPRLAAASSIRQSSLPGGLSLQWFQAPGYAAMLTLERPSGRASISLGWSRALRARPHQEVYYNRQDGFAVTAPFSEPYEVETRVQTDVFITLHRALFPAAVPE